MLAQGILGGLGMGMTMAPGMAATGQYFNKKRGAAMGSKSHLERSNTTPAEQLLTPTCCSCCRWIFPRRSHLSYRS
jgi:hypothetical protein